MGMHYRTGKILHGTEYIEGGIVITPMEMKINEYESKFIAIQYSYNKYTEKYEYFLWKLSSINYDDAIMVKTNIDINEEAECVATSILVKLYYGMINHILMEVIEEDIKQSKELNIPSNCNSKVRAFIKKYCDYGYTAKINNDFIAEIEDEINIIKEKLSI